MEESQTLVLTLVRRSCERLSKSTQACGGTSMCTNKLGIQIHLYFATFVLVPFRGSHSELRVAYNTCSMSLPDPGRWNSETDHGLEP